MIFHRFAFITLFCVVFCGYSARFAFAEVVHAYRQPSEEDLQWLLGDVTTFIPSAASPSVIVQAGHVSEKSCTLAPQGDPCRPARVPRLSKLPSPPIPPTPQVTHNKINGGLEAEDEEGVMSITSTVMDMSTPVVQMSGDRLPPPSEVPKEQNQNFPALSAEPATEHLPMLEENKHLRDIPHCSEVNPRCGGNKGDSRRGTSGGCRDFDTNDLPCICATCIACGDHRNSKKFTYNHCGSLDNEEGTCNSWGTYKSCETIFRSPAPDMIGSSAWLTGYSVVTSSSTQSAAYISTFTLPTMLLTRPNVVEHFNADVQNRIWADYRHWNNVVSIDRVDTNRLTGETYGALESRGLEHFSLGAEKLLSEKGSIEVRIPIIYQFGSNQVDNIVTSAELGNVSVFLKQVIKQGPRWTISSGIGTTLPTAENWRPFVQARLKNNAYYLVSFIGAQWHPNRSTFGQFVVQADVPIEKNELVLDGNSSVKISGQQVIRTGIQLGHWIYRSDHGKRPCRFGAVTEVNYAVVTEGSAGQGQLFNATDGTYAMSVSAFNSQKSTLTAAVGMPMVFGKLTCSNSLILPILGSDRPFSVGYNFSLTRQF